MRVSDGAVGTLYAVSGIVVCWIIKAVLSQGMDDLQVRAALYAVSGIVACWIIKGLLSQGMDDLQVRAAHCMQ